MAIVVLVGRGQLHDGGYGDIVMSPRWRLLEPLEAASGTLGFGWSTAVIVTVVMRLVRYRHVAQIRQTGQRPSADTED
jgi:hypothetical protein